MLTQWAADSNEPFAVFDRAPRGDRAQQGLRSAGEEAAVTCHLLGSLPPSPSTPPEDAHPMVVTDRCWMASITKLMAGTSMMMAVDQGLVGLDDPVSRFLPTFHDSEVATP